MKGKFGFLSWFAMALMLLVGAQTTLAEEQAVPAAAPVAETAGGDITINLDKTSLNNGGEIKITGKAPAGKAVYLEIYNDSHKVRASRFDKDVIKDPANGGGGSDKFYVDTMKKKPGDRPYVFYQTMEMPAFYRILAPEDKKDAFAAEKKKGGKWSVSALIKDLGAADAFDVPAQAKIEYYQSTLLSSIIGSRGQDLGELEAKDVRIRAMQLLKARFRSIDKVFGTNVKIQPDGSYEATLKMSSGNSPGNYKVIAIVDKDTKAEANFSNEVSFPTVYLPNAGTSMNLIWPFVITLVIAIFGVMMGAGGGFIMNPVFAQVFPALPHPYIAGTVTPTVLFSQGSGIYNYSKIKFISWKLGVGIGLAMVLGGIIGPGLTEKITMDEFKWVFGWILIVLAALMFWQTTPGYLAKNKKEQAILKEFKKRAEEAAKAKQA
ncbi:MAG TPA: permease [Desulfobulbaceae bacterium]|nr:permease [Desulfobulbaceae bacterium]